MKKTVSLFSLVGVASLAFLVACSSAAPSASMEAMPPMPQATYAPVQVVADEFNGGASTAGIAEEYQSGQDGNLANQPAAERMVIYNANLSLVVEDPARVVEQLNALAVEYGGFVVSSNVYQNSYPIGNGNYEEYDAASIQIRVDSNRLSDAMGKIKALASEVTSESVSGQDITQEYVDLDSRLKNLRATEAQLQKIMEEAKRTEDVLQVFQQLTQIRAEIEVIQGQMKYYEQSAALSAIYIDLQPDVKTQPIEVRSWSPWATVKESFEDLIVGLQELADLLIQMIICGGPLLLLVLPFAWMVRRWWKNRKVSSSAVVSKSEKPNSGS